MIYMSEDDITYKSSYQIEADNVVVDIDVKHVPDEYVPIYEVSYPHLEEPTKMMLDNIKEEVTEEIDIDKKEILDPSSSEDIKNRFLKKTEEIIRRHLPKLNDEKVKTLAGKLTHQMYGLGKIELFLNDEELEEIVINSAKEPIWVYHKEYGWLKSNIQLESEEAIYNYSSIIGRRVGRQITNLQPLMDAHLPTGDRVNATLYPISTQGNTITIRKFARNPWTVTHFIDPEIGTLSKEIAALLWLSMQYEMNIIVAGGTAAGKTALLNTLTPFIPPNQRIVTIEDTRELRLPQYLHWVPMTTREPNPEGKGEVKMLDLMVNSLRMRPDRIIVGEIRREKQAEVLFEAMLTGHSVYATLHANTANEVRRRLVNPPINIPESMLETLHLTTVQYRDRRTGIRRTREVAEVVPEVKRKEGGIDIKMNRLYYWDAEEDKFPKVQESSRLMEEIKSHTGMREKDIQDDLHSKMEVLGWMLENDIKTVDSVGKVIADYYTKKDEIMSKIRSGAEPETLLNKDMLEQLKERGLRD